MVTTEAANLLEQWLFLEPEQGNGLFDDSWLFSSKEIARKCFKIENFASLEQYVRVAIESKQGKWLLEYNGMISKASITIGVYTRCSHSKNSSAIALLTAYLQVLRQRKNDLELLESNKKYLPIPS